MELTGQINNTESNSFNFSDFFGCHYSERYKKKVLYMQFCLFKKQKDYTPLLSYCYNIVEQNRTPEKQNEFIFYIDLKNAKMRQIDTDFIKKLIKELENKYPELSERIYLANIPAFFKVCYSIVKVALHKDTRKKVFFEKKSDGKIDFTNNIDEII